MPCSSQKIDIRKVNFKKVFESYFSSLCVFAFKFVKDEELAKDIVQEVFVKIWNSGIEFESEKSMKVYFYLATKNTCFDHLKKEKRKNLTNDLSEADRIEDDAVVNEIIREETYRMLEEAIEQLPEKERIVVRLNLKALTNQEIAEEMGVSVNTVKTHKLLAFRKLRELFGDQFTVLLLIEFYKFFS